MTPIDINRKLELIHRHAGEVFHTKTGLELTYSVSGLSVRTSRTEFVLSLADFRKALELVPLPGPGSINWAVRGAAYI